MTDDPRDLHFSDGKPANTKTADAVRGRTVPGLRIESASSVVLRDAIQQHMAVFAHVIRQDRVAGQAVVATYIDGLAGAVALTIAGGQGSRSEVIEATIKRLREAIDRDLVHLALS